MNSTKEQIISELKTKVLAVKLKLMEEKNSIGYNTNIEYRGYVEGMWTLNEIITEYLEAAGE